MELLDSRYSWGRLGLSLLISLLIGVGMWSVVLILPDVAAEFGIDRGAASLPYTGTMAGYGLGNLLIGRAVDRWGITRALTGAALCSSVGFAAAGLAPTLWILAAAQVLIGFGTGAGFGPLIADVSHWFRRRRGVAVGVAASGNYLSGTLWPLLLTPLVASIGWRGAYLWVALVVPLTVIPLSLALRRRFPGLDLAAPGAPGDAGCSVPGLSPRTMVALLAVAGVGCCVAMSMPQVHLVAMSVDLGFGAEAGSHMLSAMLGAGVISRLGSGWLADRLGGLRTLLIGSALQALALLLYLPAHSLPALMAVSAVFGSARGVSCRPMR